MGQSVRRRRHGQLIYRANATDTLRLHRGMVMRALMLHIEGQIDDPTNAYATIERGDEWAVVRRIRLIANGTDVLRDIDGNSLWWHNFFWYGVKPPVEPLIGAGGADPTFCTSLILPLWMPRSVRPMDTALDTRVLSDLVLEITWGDYLSISSTATGWITEPTIEVNALEAFGLPRNTRFAQWRQWMIQREITANNAVFQIDLPVGNAYRGFLLNTTDADVDVNTILNRIAVKSGNVEFHAMNALEWQQAARIEYGIDRGYSGVAYDDLRQGDANDLDGWYPLDLVTDGYLTEALDTQGWTEIMLELDVNVGVGTTMLNVIPSLYVPVRGAA